MREKPDELAVLDYGRDRLHLDTAPSAEHGEGLKGARKAPGPRTHGGRSLPGRSTDPFHERSWMDRDADEELLEGSLIGSGGEDVGPDLGPGSEGAGITNQVELGRRDDLGESLEELAGCPFQDVWITGTRFDRPVTHKYAMEALRKRSRPLSADRKKRWWF